MSTADKLNKLLETKQAIKQAIIDKGVEVADDTVFADYPSKIDSIPMEGGDPYYEELYNQRTSNGTNMVGLFYYCTAPELDLSNIDTSNVTSMQQMFHNCTSQIKLGNWDTSKVTNTHYMFGYFTNNNKYLDLSVLDFGNVTKAERMFDNCNVDYVDIRNLNMDLSKLGTFNTYSNYSPFYNILGTSLDLSNWDIGNRSNLNSLFYYGRCKKIDLTNWVTTAVTDMGYMFYSNSNLEELIMPDWDMTNVTSSSSMLYSCSKLKYVDVSRSNATTITKLTSLLPTKTQTNFGTIAVPEDTPQAAYDALIAKYWIPIGAAMTPVPTNIEIIVELDEIYPGKSTKVYLGAYEPWNADTSKVELVLVSDSSIATMTDDNEVISTGVLGDIVLEVRIKDTQEVIGTKTIVVSETDSYPGLIKFRAASKPSTSSNIITVNGSGKKLSALTYDSIADIYSYDVGAPITSIKFGSDSNINELVKLDTGNVTDMGSMFTRCSSLTSIDVSNFDTSNVTNMSAVFYMCDKLASIDLSNFDTSNVTDMSWMFQDCYNLTSLDLSNWNTSNVTDMSYMFARCQSLITLDLSNFDTSNVTAMATMLFACDSLHTLRLDNCSHDTISKIITSSSLPTKAIEGVTRTIYCKELEAYDITPPTNWVFSYISHIDEELDVPLYMPGEFTGDEKITRVFTLVNETHTDLSKMFYNCTNLISVYTENWNTSNVNTMNYMFRDCNSLTSIDVSNFDTSNVTTMSAMFSGCQSLTSIDVSNFDTSNVTDMYAMFNLCSKLITLDLSNFDTSKVTDMDRMFYFCKRLTSIDLSNFDTSNVTTMSAMFRDCNNLEELDIRNFNIVYKDNAITPDDKANVSNMFNGCTRLKVLHLENCSLTTVVHLLENGGLPARENNDGIMYMSVDAYQGAKHIVPDGWTIFTD